MKEKKNVERPKPVDTRRRDTIAVFAVNSISRSQNAVKAGMISRGTQTGMGGDLLEITEKRRLIRKQLAILLHAVLCRVRDELIGNTGQNAEPCPTAFCGMMKGVVSHIRTCRARQDCAYQHCLSSRQILTHWKICTQTMCPVCSNLRRIVPAYLAEVVQNPRWRKEIMARFQWLITFVAPAGFRMPPNTSTSPPLNQQTQRPADEEHQKPLEE